MHHEHTVIAITGDSNMDPFNAKDKHLGRTITSLERKYVHHHFASNVCKTELKCHNDIEQLIHALEHTQNINQFNQESITYNILDPFLAEIDVLLSYTINLISLQQVYEVKNIIDNFFDSLEFSLGCVHLSKKAI